MSETRQCPQCRGELPADAPEGLCPECLLKARLETETGPQSGPESTPAERSPGHFIPPSTAELASLFPQLEILELLGSGGMGAVYKARQPQLDRLVALKILPREVGSDPAFAERFAREARALARLSHANIVAVYDFGHVPSPRPLSPAGRGEPESPLASLGRGAGGEGPLYYLVMEYVDGVDLRRMLRAGQLQPREALAIVPQICEALQFAHDEGIVHRDIKPENILVDRKGRVKIADFGLAKLLRPSPPSPPAGEGPGVRAFTLTGTGQVMGTLNYMAPEQIEHPQEVDHRADIYSLGVVFYEMLTGELPIGRFAPPSKKVEVDVRLDEVVLKTLEKEPGRRYQHVSEVKTDVETIASAGPRAREMPKLAPSASAGPRRKLLLQVSLVYLVLMWVAFTVFWKANSPVTSVIALIAVAAGLALAVAWLVAIFVSVIGTRGSPLHRREEEPERGYQQAREVKTDVETIARQAPPPRPPSESPSAAVTAAHVEKARAQVVGPAVGLIVTGVAHWVLFVAIALIVMGVFASWQPAPESLQRASPGAEGIIGGLFPLAVPMVGLVTGVIMIVGAVKMMRLRSHRWAMAASVAALLPCSPAGLLGLIVGIWSLAVLSRPEVKAAFAAQAGGAQWVAPSGAAPRGGPWLGCLVAAIVAIVAVPAGLLGLVFLYWLSAERGGALAPPGVDAVGEVTAATAREVPMTEAERDTPGLSVFRYQLDLAPGHRAEFSSQLWHHGKPGWSGLAVSTARPAGGQVQLRLQQGETLSPQGAGKLRWDWRTEHSGVKAETNGWIDDPFAAAKGRMSTWRGTERWELVPDKEHTLLILRGWERPSVPGVSESYARNPTAFAEAIARGEIPRADVELYLKVRVRRE